jgi:hypothetical protein
MRGLIAAVYTVKREEEGERREAGGDYRGRLVAERQRCPRSLGIRQGSAPATRSAFRTPSSAFGHIGDQPRCGYIQIHAEPIA